MTTAAFPRLIGTSKIKDVFGTGYTTPKIGIEVELERITGEWDDETEYWRMHEDGSLRNNGKEFVSVPLARTQIAKALQELDSVIADMGEGNASASYRCGIHIHYNVGHMQVGHLVDCLLGLTMLEPVLFAVFAPERSQSVFCVPWNRSMRWAQNMAGLGTERGSDWAANDYFQSLLANASKYQSINILPVARYGTIEFRMFPSTTDVDLIGAYVKVVQNCMEVVGDVGAKAIMNALQNNDYDHIFNAVFDGVADNWKASVDVLCEEELAGALMHAKNVIYS